VAGASKQDVINRLKRIEGQVKGVQRMIDDGKECCDILDQVAAARTALYNAGILILESHARECIFGASESEATEEAVEALVKVIRKFARS
jgi:DNA-binding FrmR family transcriptional regulator